MSKIRICWVTLSLLTATFFPTTSFSSSADTDKLKTLLDSECINLKKDKLFNLLDKKFSSEIEKGLSPDLLKIMEGVIKRTDFDGIKPRIAYHLMRDLDGDNEGSDEPYYLYFSASDDGVTWGSPVGMPFDGGHKTWWYQSIDTGSQGQTAIAAMLSSSSGSNTCGSPKLYSSTDNVNWTVCGADADDSKDADSYYVSLNFAGNDKLYLAFRQHNDNSSYGGFKSGLILWREP